MYEFSFSILFQKNIYLNIRLCIIFLKVEIKSSHISFMISFFILYAFNGIEYIFKNINKITKTLKYISDIICSEPFI